MDALLEVEGIGEDKAGTILEAARDLVAAKAAPVTTTVDETVAPAETTRDE
jgi:hypothetical protein